MIDPYAKGYVSMSIIINIPAQPATVTDTNTDLWLIDRTKWILDGNVKNDNGAMVQAYKLDAGDPRYPLRAAVRQQIDKGGVMPLARNTLMLYPTLKRSDSVAETENVLGEAGFGLVVNVPADNSLDKEDVRKWVTTAFGAFFKTTTSGVGDTDSITSLYRRILAIL